ncbi:MAG: hypothetical protein NZ899_05880 [Thermoguttaceae bacterium]|nr:hypothetical protein [Thermoguttaceae bacterium]MDW8079470.1 hypothetical protein [Thermoguttaceae bacterium]
MYRLPLLLLVAAAIGFVGGCGGSTGPGAQKVQPVQVQPTDAMRSALESIAQSGQVGSEGLTIQENIEKLRASDASKADQLAKDYQELQATTDPAKVKAKAAEMLKKL